MKWKFLIACDSEKFVTSDNPVVIHGRGLLSNEARVIFPVSRDLGFYGTWAKMQEGYEDVQNETVKRFNFTIVISASRFVCSSHKSEEFNEQVQEHKDSAPKWEIT